MSVVKLNFVCDCVIRIPSASNC